MNDPRTAVLRSLHGSRAIRMTIIVCVLFLGVASVVSHALEYRGVGRFSKDFALDYSSGKAVLDGENPYAPIRVLVERYLDPPPEALERNILPGANWHTPFKLLVTMPLTALPFRAAGIVWLLFCATTFVLAGFLVGRELKWSRSVAVLLGIGTLGVPVVQTDLSAGNLNGPMLLLLVLAWRFLKGGSPLMGGAMLGVLVALKFFPALLAIPLIGRKRLREVGVAAAVSMILTGAGALTLGTDHLDSFLSAGRGDQGFDYWDTSPANIAWWGMATRWLTPNGWVNAGIDAPELGLILAAAGIAAFVALLFIGRSRLSSDPFWAAIPLMLLVWPIVWIHYLVLALPWVLIAGRQLARRSPGTAGWLAFGAVASIIMMGFPPGTPSLGEAETIAVAVPYQLPSVALIGAALVEAARRGGRLGAGSRDPL